MGPGGGNNKRRTHADNIPDSEKPFSCEREYFFFLLCILFNLSIHTYKDSFHRISITPCITMYYKMANLKMGSGKEGGILTMFTPTFGHLIIYLIFMKIYM